MELARSICPRCRRPGSVCYCAHLTPLQSATRVLILQVPREARVPIGTARIARLCLPGAELRIGMDFQDDPVVQAALRCSPYLLYPGPKALELAEARLERPLTLIVVDGTWRQVRRLLTRNPSLARLPQLRFTPPRPSAYRIRREPAPDYVATIEALAHVLGALEGDPERFAALLRPFDAMVEQQLHFARTLQGWRTRAKLRRPRAPRPPKVAARLRDPARDVVCVHGEANVGPQGLPDSQPPEIVQWLARRLSTGESFEAIVAPRRPLAGVTPLHLELPAERLANGEPWPSFVARWHAFTRPGDLFCTWGVYPFDVLALDGLPRPAAWLDVRPAANDFLQRRSGGLEDFAARLELAPRVPWAPGRGGLRIATLCTVVERMRSAAAALEKNRAVGIEP
ncbi:MAG: DTW domain-containing protein [Planctomycetes bacterium]|nr:DTW domain-containing protein [Planctomycetota bacterium]